MKNGKIDFKSMGIASIIAIIGIGIGFIDFTKQKGGILFFLQGVLNIDLTTQIPQNNDIVAMSSFGGITIAAMVLAIICIATLMYSIRGMA
jgi:hypothetical protein